MQVLVLLGDQLFPDTCIQKISPDRIFMAEDIELCSRFKFHKHKLVFFLSAMRTYAQALKKYPVDYHELDDTKYFDKLKAYVVQKKITVIHIFEIEDSFMRKRMQLFAQKMSIDLKEHLSPMFLTPKSEFQDYLKQVKKPFMKTFYERRRKKLSLLVNEKGQPVGGKWSFDEDNRSKIPKNHHVEAVLFSKPSAITKEVMSLVDKKFKTHPGDSKEFWMPVERKHALGWFELFLKERFKNFGTYEDAISSQTPLLYHSGISAFLNTGLLLPKDVVRLTLQYAKENKIAINHLEGFIRQIIGWREFVRGIYHNFEEKMETENFWKHTQKLGPSWYSGTTGIPPLDDCIKKVSTYGYLHHIERLMIVSNLMLLSEVHPKEVYKWFMEMFIDSGDWVMAANVYGMGQMSEGGIFATKPYICGSNYIMKMSDYKKGPWCDIMDGLYWSFIDKNRKFFLQNPRMSIMVGSLDKMDRVRKKKLFEAAKKFKNEHLI